MSQSVLNVLMLVPIFLFSLCVHEYAHGWMASKRGDQTAFLSGRLTLSPFAHADLVGTILLPVFCILNNFPFIGWAKPVPVDERNLKYGRRDMALVAMAGPASNLVLAVLGALLLFALVRLPLNHPILETVGLFTVTSMQINIMLALFNLIPIPPLDGFMILQGFLPHRMAYQLYSLTQYSGILLLILLMSGGFRYLQAPVQYLFHTLLKLAA